MSAAAEAAGGGRLVAGVAVRYGEWSRPMPGPRGLYRERIQRGAFDSSLDSPRPVFAFYQHETRARLPLGRRGVNLAVWSDADALRFALDLPATSEADDVLSLVRGGLVAAASFTFKARAGGESWDSSRSLRTVTAADLFEVALVVQGQYAGSGVALPPDARWSDRTWEARKVLVGHG